MFCRALLVLLQFNLFSIGLGFASILVVLIYPFMKRITDWPQAVLGLAFSWGALMGWAAIFGRLDVAPVLLYFGAISWTIAYDTIYAHQDKEDDALVGVRSTARLFAERTKTWLSFLFLAAVMLFTGAFWLAGAGFLAYLGLACAAAHMIWQVRTLDIDDGDVCLMVFRSNEYFGWILFSGLVADALFRNLV